MDTPDFTRRDLFKTTAALGVTGGLGAAVAAEDSGPPRAWKNHRTFRVAGLQVSLSEPVLVKRSRWFCWFPSLIRQPNGVLWALMSAYADIHVSDAVCYLSRSQDGGLTWDEPRVIGDAGHSHLILADGSAVVIPYYLRPRAGGSIGAPCTVVSPDGRLTMRPSGLTVSGWPKQPGTLGPDLATSSFCFNGQVVRGLKNEYLMTLYGNFEGEKRYSLALAESVDGFIWRIRSVIADSGCKLDGEEGPCESATCRLEDGRLMNIFRLASFVPYGQTFSSDDGRTWSEPKAIQPASVEPSLVAMPDGMVALSGGRSGIFVWLDAKGDGVDWHEIDIVAAHNAARPDDRINPDSTKAWQLPAAEMHRQKVGGFSSCYTELIPLDDRSLLLIYDRLGCGWHAIPDDVPETNSVWVTRISIG